MSRIEELLYSAEDYGRRQEVLTRVTKLLTERPTMKREEAYEKAYSEIMNT
tara:strand:+ start:688 stop:840 length:153 start_codon:yes stop_codon:yes gene_type:complete